MSGSRAFFGDRHLDPEKMLEPVRYLIERCWTRCAELGLDVVLDSGFWSRRDRDETRAKAAALGAEYRLYDVSVADEIAWLALSDATKTRKVAGS
jgi:predicted kinase